MQKQIFLVFALLGLALGTFSPGLLIPLYIYPTRDLNGDCNHASYIDVGDASHVDGLNVIAIVNPSNGPADPADTWTIDNYDACISYLQNKGVTVIGYVHTKVGYPSITGYRTLQDVKDDIDEWYTQFSNIDGIFIDEVTNNWPVSPWDSHSTAKTFYQDVTDYVLGKNTQVTPYAVLNPGSAYNPDLMDKYQGNTTVISVLFEGTENNYDNADCSTLLWTTSQGSFTKGPWCQYVPNWDGIEALKTQTENGTLDNYQNAVLVYSVPSGDATTTDRIVDDGLAQYIGWFYVTDQSGWSTLASSAVWNAQIAAL